MRIRKEADSLKIIVNTSETEVDQFLIVEIIADMVLSEINSKNKTVKKTLPDDVRNKKPGIHRNYYSNTA
jgi:hypothetical protein